MKVHFSKYHGTGNDFIMVDGRGMIPENLSSDDISSMCDRHSGIGADGLIILTPEESYDFRMNYFNADGFKGSMCGNGGRCISAFAREIGIIQDRCRFLASDGPHSASISPDGIVRLGLNSVEDVIEMEDGIFLDTGSPHMVIFKEEIDRLDIVSEGRKIRNEKRFKNGTNVNFVQLTGEGISVRTYERGVEDETLSCGTGVTASAIAASIKGHTVSGHGTKVKTKGGFLTVEFRNAQNGIYTDVCLSGPAVKVFDGILVL